MQFGKQQRFGLPGGSLGTAGEELVAHRGQLPSQGLARRRGDGVEVVIDFGVLAGTQGGLETVVDRGDLRQVGVGVMHWGDSGVDWLVVGTGAVMGPAYPFDQERGQRSGVKMARFLK